MSKRKAFIARVDALANKLQTVAITLEEVEQDEDEVYIVWFERISDKKGEGFKFLQEICKFADQMGIIISLTLNPSVKKLLPFYENLEFVQDGPATSVGIPMYRHYDREVVL